MGSPCAARSTDRSANIQISAVLRSFVRHCQLVGITLLACTVDCESHFPGALFVVG